jgi:hypothetical protein
MAAIRFRVESDVLDEDVAQYAVDVHPAVLETSFFVFPTRLTVNGTDLLGTSEAQAESPLPVLGFYASLKRSLARLRDGAEDQVLLEGIGSLRLRRRDRHLTVTSAEGDRQASESVADIAKASESFGDRVRVLLLQSIPGISQHPAWPSWFGRS